MQPNRNDPCPCGSGKKFKKCCAGSGKYEQVYPVLGHLKAKEPSPEKCNAVAGLYAGGRYAEADAASLELVEHFPESGFSWKIRGAVLLRLLRRVDALAALDKAVSFYAGQDPESHNLRGSALRSLGRNGEAEASYKRALGCDPRFFEAHNNLGIMYLEAGRLDAAEASFRSALKANPKYAEAYSNLGALLNQKGCWAEAEEKCRHALQLKPAFANGYNNLGAIFLDLKRLPEAESAFRTALQYQPSSPMSWINLGRVLQYQGRTDEARAGFLQANSYGLGSGRAAATFCLPPVMSLREEVLKSRRDFEHDLEALIADGVAIDDPISSCNTNFYLAYQGLNDRSVQMRIASFYAQACPSLLYVSPHCKASIDTSRPLRIGIYSMFFGSHPVMTAFGKLIDGFSSTQDFHVTLISAGDIDMSLFQGFSGDRLVLPRNLVEARRLISNQELDVLMYLDIGMEPFGYFLAFSRLAHVQCVFGGHPVTTGIPTVDYFVVSGLIEPQDAEAHYSEKLFRTGAHPFIFAVQPPPPRLKARAELGLPEDGHIYMCPMRLQKMHPDFDEAIARILARDDSGSVVLFDDIAMPYAKAMLLARFQQTIPEHLRRRIVFMPWLSDSGDFFSALANADVVLDPFHFGLGTTLRVVVGANVPLVTWPGEFMRGRVSLGCCQLLEIPECIASDMDAYPDIAVRIASDEKMRASIQERMAKHRYRFGEYADMTLELGGFFREAVSRRRDEIKRGEPRNRFQ